VLLLQITRGDIPAESTQVGRASRDKSSNEIAATASFLW